MRKRLYSLKDHSYSHLFEVNNWFYIDKEKDKRHICPTIHLFTCKSYFCRSCMCMWEGRGVCKHQCAHLRAHSCTASTDQCRLSLAPPPLYHMPVVLPVPLFTVPFVSADSPLLFLFYHHSAIPSKLTERKAHRWNCWPFHENKRITEIISYDLIKF